MAIVGDLMDFQSEDVPFYMGQPRSLILYEPRLGKTVITSYLLAKDARCTKILIVCSKNAMGVWADHIKAWFKYLIPDTSLEVRLIRGKGSTAPLQRKQAYLKPMTKDVTVCITTFGSLNSDFEFLMLPSTRKAGVIFNAVIGDEVHIRMKNRNNKCVKQFKELAKQAFCKRIHLLSGTMGGKWGPADFYACLNILNRLEFTSYWGFVSKYCEVIDGQWGKEIIGVKNQEEWYKLLNRYSRRRFRKEVAPQMPQVCRDLLKVDLNPTQEKLLYELSEEKYVDTGGTVIVASTSLEEAMRRRQILCCPAIFNPALGVGGAMENLIEKLTDDDATEEDRHTVIFTAFRQALPHFESALQTAGFKHIYQLYGGIEPEEQARKIELWRQNKGIILCTIKYAQAFSLVPAQTCYTIGYEWDPNENKQAEDRLVPQQGVNPINSYYYCYRNTSDENMAEAVNIKNRIISLTVGSASNGKVNVKA